MMTFSDWEKADIRVGEIKSAEPVEGSSKLFRMQVGFG